MAERIAIASDHGGYALKEKLVKALKKARYKVDDEGCYSGESCDYPEYGFAVAEKVSKKKAKKGIIICKTGIGMAVVANKVPGVRAGSNACTRGAATASSLTLASVQVRLRWQALAGGCSILSGRKTGAAIRALTIRCCQTGNPMPLSTGDRHDPPI